MALIKFGQTFFTHWRKYKARLFKVSGWIANPLPSGSTVLMPSRVRLKLIAQDADSSFTIRSGTNSITYNLSQGEEFVTVVNANNYLVTDNAGRVEVDLGHLRSDFAVIIGVGHPITDGYGLSRYGVDPYGEQRGFKWEQH